MSLFSSSAELLCQWKVCSPSHITGNPVTPEEVVRADSLSGLLIALGRPNKRQMPMQLADTAKAEAAIPKTVICGSQVDT